MDHGTGDNIYLVDSATTHHSEKSKIFSELMFIPRHVSTIAGPVQIIEGPERAHMMLPNGTHLFIKDALFSSSSRTNLISFKDIRMNGYHIETVSECNKEYLYIVTSIGSQKHILKKLRALSSGLYYTTISNFESHSVTSKTTKSSPKLSDPKTLLLWHDRLGHPGATMLKKIGDNSFGHSLENYQLTIPSRFLCISCSQGKLIARPSFTKIAYESPSFLQRIQGDICRPINPPSGPFKYFMVLINASTRWLDICLLSTRNIAFARLLTQIIKLRAHFPDYPIKSIRLDNEGEFAS